MNRDSLELTLLGLLLVLYATENWATAAFAVAVALYVLIDKGSVE